jgi:hypothetical protein
MKKWLPVLVTAALLAAFATAPAWTQSIRATLVTFGGTAQPVTVSGGVTANAGTNLNTSALALESGNLATVVAATKLEDAAHASGDRGIMALCVRKVSATDLSVGATDGDYEPCQVDGNGQLYVTANISNSTLGVIGSVANDGAAGTTFPVLQGGRASAAAPSDVSADGDAVVGWFLRNGAQAIQQTYAGILAATGNGVAGTGTPRVTIASDNTAFSVNATLQAGSAQIGHLEANQSTNVAQLNGVAVTMGNGVSGTGVQRVTLASDSTGTVGLATGSNTIGALTANQSVNVAQINGVTPLMGAGNTGTGSARVTIASDQAITPHSLGTTATTTDAASGCYLQSAASTNATSCKASAGNFYGVRAVNTTATLYYLRLYNLSTSPTCSSATGFIESIPIPASTTGAGIMAVLPIPIGYGTGIAFCFTGGGSSTDNTNAATGVYVTLYYK